MSAHPTTVDEYFALFQKWGQIAGKEGIVFAILKLAPPTKEPHS